MPWPLQHVYAISLTSIFVDALHICPWPQRCTLDPPKSGTTLVNAPLARKKGKHLIPPSCGPIYVDALLNFSSPVASALQSRHYQSLAPLFVYAIPLCPWVNYTL